MLATLSGPQPPVPDARHRAHPPAPEWLVRDGVERVLQGESSPQSLVGDTAGRKLAFEGS